MSWTKADEKYIRRCLALAKKGAGRVSPNPLVGAVLVKAGRIIGQGFHRSYGLPHAEIEAINSCKEAVKGATLYCNLEPCCHTVKQTPPCVPEIISRGIKKVVVANIDPNPQVAGQGLKMLQNAGIETSVGVLADEGRHLNRFFFTFMKKKRPYVLVKIAQSLDGKIASHPGKLTAITGQPALREVHGLRAAMDAVLVGAGTVNADNPGLTVRLVEGRHPRRLVLDGRLTSNPSAGLYTAADQSLTTVFTSSRALQKRRDLYPANLNMVAFPAEDNGRIELKALLNYLYKQRVVSLLVEGGQQIFSAFLNQALFDEIYIYQSPKIFNAGLPALQPDKEISLKLVSSERVGEDIKLIYHPLYE